MVHTSFSVRIHTYDQNGVIQCADNVLYADAIQSLLKQVSEYCKCDVNAIQTHPYYGYSYCNIGNNHFIFHFYKTSTANIALDDVIDNF